MEYRYRSKYGYVRVEGQDQTEADNRYASLLMRLDKANAEIRRAFKETYSYLERDEHKGQNFPVH